MLSWNQFINLPNIKPLPVNEQHRQYFIYKSDSFYRKQANIGGRTQINVADMYIDDDYIDDDYF